MSEAERLRVLASTLLVGSAPEPAFDRLTRLASEVTGAPVALVSLIDDVRNFIKSQVGLSEPYATCREAPIAQSFCAIAVRERSELIIEDSRVHPLVKDHPATHVGVLSYAGIPLVIEGQVLGTLCVNDGVPRVWTEKQLANLRDLAASVTSEIELRMTTQRAAERQAFVEALLEAISDGVLATDDAGTVLLANGAARRLFPVGLEPGKPLPANWGDLYVATSAEGRRIDRATAPLRRALEGQDTDGITMALQGPASSPGVWIDASGRPVRDAAGRVVAAIVVCRDVSERMRSERLHQTLVRHIPKGAVVTFDRELRCTQLDGSAVRAVQGAAEGAVGQSMLAMAGTKPGEPLYEALGAVYRGALAGRESTTEYIHPASGRVFEVHVAPIADVLGHVTGGIALALDRTAERLAEADARRADQVNGAILQNLPNGIVFLVDHDLRYVAVKGGVNSEIGLPADDGPWSRVVGRQVVDTVPAENLDDVLDVYRRALTGERVRTEVTRGARILEVNAAPLVDAEGAVTHALAFLYDVTDRRREAEELRRTRDGSERDRALLRASLEHIPEGVVLFDAERRVILANPAFASLFHVPLAEVEGMREEELRRRAEIVADEKTAARLFDAAVEDGDFELARPARRVLRRRCNLVALPSGVATLATWRDVTAEREELEERDRELLVDALTGIANRRAAELALQAVERRLSSSDGPIGGSSGSGQSVHPPANASNASNAGPMSVAMVDVDHFKAVNDMFGHPAGDAVLQRVASTLSGAARGTDLVARWGGEEFLAILRGRVEGALVFAERARAAVEAIAVSSIPRVTVSVGVAEIRPGESPMDAVARADARLYDAKRLGRNRVAS